MLSYPPHHPQTLDVAKLNLQGIHKLQDKNYWDAVSCFWEGIRALIAYNDRQAGNRDPAGGFVGDKQHSDRFPSRDLILCIDLPKCKEIYEMNNMDFRFTVFNRALHVSLDSIASLPAEDYCNLLSGIFLYNMALAHHCCALEMGNSATLAKAFGFYSIAYEAFSKYYLPPRTGEEHAAESKSLREVTSLAFLVLANNVGHVHSFFSNHEQAKVCADEIYRRLSILLASPTSEFVRLFSEKEIRVFMLNATFFYVTDHIPAAAA